MQINLLLLLSFLFSPLMLVGCGQVEEIVTTITQPTETSIDQKIEERYGTGDLVLSFKEQTDENENSEEYKLYKETIRQNAQAALDKIKNGEDFEKIGKEEVEKYINNTKFEKIDEKFESALQDTIKEQLLLLKAGEYTKNLVETGGTFIINSFGEAVEDKGISIIKLITANEKAKYDKAVYVSHLLISYAGADSAEASVTRTNDEAYTLIKEIKEKLENGEDFSTLAEKYSDDLATKKAGGKLEAPITGDGTYIYDFEQNTLELENVGQISDIVKTPFGYHLIKADEIKKDIKEKQYTYEILTYSTLKEPWTDTELTGDYVSKAEIQFDKYYQPYVMVQFTDEGTELFAQITEKNLGKKVGIFINDQLISAPTVNEKITGGSATIVGQFTKEEAETLAETIRRTMKAKE